MNRIDAPIPHAQRRKDRIAIGIRPEPYPPAEARHEVTRRTLDALARREGLAISILTRSALVTRDLDLLRVLSSRGRLSVAIAISTTRPDLARRIEPFAPSPARRFEVVRILSSAGIETGVLAAPLLPGITDSRVDLEILAATCSASGARFLSAEVRLLPPAALGELLPFLDTRFRDLARTYRVARGRRSHDPGRYRTSVERELARVRKSYALAARPSGDGDGWRELQTEMGLEA